MDYVVLFSGAVVSLIVQLIKKYGGTDKVTTLSSVVIISFIASLGWWYIQDKGLTDTFMKIVLGAGTFYAFIIRNLEDPSPIGER